MIRINVVTEGQSELFFVKKNLNSYFNASPILDARCILTSRDTSTNYEYRGGLKSYAHARNDIIKWLKEDASAYVSTMFDFFRLPTDFPGYEDAIHCPTHEDSVRLLESRMQDDIESEVPPGAQKRFIPYIQLHEFEALLFTDINVLKFEYFEDEDIRLIDRLYEATKNIPPEEINHGPETAPSKRLLKTVGYQKGETVTDFIDVITIERIRDKCPHFSAWLTQLSELPPLSAV